MAQTLLEWGIFIWFNPVREVSQDEAKQGMAQNAGQASATRMGLWQKGSKEKTNSPAVEDTTMTMIINAFVDHLVADYLVYVAIFKTAKRAFKVVTLGHGMEKFGNPWSKLWKSQPDCTSHAVS